MYVCFIDRWYKKWYGIGRPEKIHRTYLLASRRRIWLEKMIKLMNTARREKMVRIYGEIVRIDTDLAITRSRRIPLNDRHYTYKTGSTILFRYFEEEEVMTKQQVLEKIEYMRKDLASKKLLSKSIDRFLEKLQKTILELEKTLPKHKRKIKRVGKRKPVKIISWGLADHCLNIRNVGIYFDDTDDNAAWIYIRSRRRYYPMIVNEGGGEEVIEFDSRVWIAGDNEIISIVKNPRQDEMEQIIKTLNERLPPVSLNYIRKAIQDKRFSKETRELLATILLMLS